MEQGEKISNLENTLQTLIHLPLTICKRTLKRFRKDFAKTKHVVQAWSKMLKMKKQIHAYLVSFFLLLAQIQASFALTLCKLVQSLQNNHPFSNAYMCCKKLIYVLLRSIPTHNYALPILPLLRSITTLIHVLVKPRVKCCHATMDIRGL